MNVSRFKLITFDVTNTILKLKDPPGLKYANLGAMYGIKCRKDVVQTNFALNLKKMNKTHPNFGLKTNQMTWENWWKKLVVDTFRDSECDAPDEKLDIVASQLIELYKTNHCWKYVDGAVGLLSFLNYKKIPLGVISNFDPRLEDILVNMRIRRFFRFVLTSYEAGAEKPDPGIFNKAMDKSGQPTLKPEECLHIGDDVLLDYFAAVNNKWCGYLIINGDLRRFVIEHPTVNPTHVFVGMYDLLKFVTAADPAKILLKQTVKPVIKRK